MEEIDEAYKDALTGVPSKRPLIEMTIPSVLDRTISPPGMTSMWLLYDCIHIEENEKKKSISYKKAS